MNKHYNGEFTLFIHDNYYTINGSLTIDKDLNKLLTGILNTPVNQRINSEIKHTIKPVTKEIVNTANLTSADQVIQAIKTL